MPKLSEGTSPLLADSCSAAKILKRENILFPLPVNCRRNIIDKQMIVWGKNYAVETEEYRITKRLQKGKKEGYITAYSSNIPMLSQYSRLI